MGAFEKATLYRFLVECVRYWVIECFLRTGDLPTAAYTCWVYPDGPTGIDWGNAPGPDDPKYKPLRGKRIRVTFEIEEG